MYFSIWLVNADLSNADLRGAILNEANLSEANLSGTKYNKDTKWPAGFDTIRAEAIKV